MQSNISELKEEKRKKNKKKRKKGKITTQKNVFSKQQVLELKKTNTKTKNPERILTKEAQYRHQD